MKFKYTARTKQGELQAGNITAGNREKALGILSGHELFVLELTQALEVHWYERLTSYLNKVKIKDLMVFTRQFATLLEAKVSISDSLRTLHQQTTSKRLREAIVGMS